MPICPGCGFEATAGSTACPLCGHDLTPPASETEDRLPAWEDAAVPFPRNLLETWRESLFEPGRFFGGVAYEGSLARPLLYYLVIAVAGAFFTLWWQAVGWMPARALLGGDTSGPEALVSFFLSPFAALFGLAVWTLVLHLFVVIVAPRRRGLGATARVICYSGGPMVLTAVPFLGVLVGGVWTVVLQVVGIRSAHRTTTGRAVAAVLLPVAALLLLVGMLVVVAVVAGLALLEMYR